MGLLSLFKRQSRGAQAAAGGDVAQVVAAARTHAKRRLVGAVVLLGIGVIAFPLLFETQPRPIPVDIPIDIPRKDAAPPLAVPPVRPAPVAAASVPVPVTVVPLVAESKVDAVTPAGTAATGVPTAEPVPKAIEAKAQAKPPATAEVKAVADGTVRFVVQIGAFADANGARETRAKVDKLGLRTYTQTIDTDKGKRIRVRLGPFASRDEAEQVAAKVKAAGLPAAVLTL